MKFFGLKKKIKSRIMLHARLRWGAITFPLLFGSIGQKEIVSSQTDNFVIFYFYYTSVKVLWYLYILEGSAASRWEILLIEFAEHILCLSTQPHQWSSFNSFWFPWLLRWEVLWSYDVILVVGMEAYPWILELLDSRGQKSAALLEKKRSISTIIEIILLRFFISIFNTFVVTNEF